MLFTSSSAQGTLRRKLFAGALGLAISGSVCVGQQRPISATISAPLRISVASNVDQGCRNGILAATMQDNTEARLRAAGIAVSQIHNAQLTVDIDCVAVGHSQRSAAAIHQCLSLAEVMAASADPGRTALATTWRNCQSYTCSGAACQLSARSRMNVLMDLFLDYFHDRFRKRDATAAVTPNRQSVHPTGTPSRSSVSSGRPPEFSDIPKPAGPRGKVIFYSIYMMACFSVLLYWQFRRQPY